MLGRCRRGIGSGRGLARGRCTGPALGGDSVRVLAEGGRPDSSRPTHRGRSRRTQPRPGTGPGSGGGIGPGGRGPGRPAEGASARLGEPGSGPTGHARPGRSGTGAESGGIAGLGVGASLLVGGSRGAGRAGTTGRPVSCGLLIVIRAVDGGVRVDGRSRIIDLTAGRGIALPGVLLDVRGARSGVCPGRAAGALLPHGAGTRSRRLGAGRVVVGRTGSLRWRWRTPRPRRRPPSRSRYGIAPRGHRHRGQKRCPAPIGFPPSFLRNCSPVRERPCRHCRCRHRTSTKSPLSGWGAPIPRDRFRLRSVIELRSMRSFPGVAPDGRPAEPDGRTIGHHHRRVPIRRLADRCPGRGLRNSVDRGLARAVAEAASPGHVLPRGLTAGRRCPRGRRRRRRLSRDVAAAPPAPGPAAGSTGNTSVTGSDGAAGRGSGTRGGTYSGAEPPLVATASEPARTAERRIIQSIMSTAAAATLSAYGHPGPQHAAGQQARPRAGRTRSGRGSGPAAARFTPCAAVRQHSRRPHRPCRSSVGQLPASARWP